MPSFKDLEQLGQGGFGVVHRCAQESDGSLFARKTLTLTDIGSIKRFQREVRIIQKLNHPGIIRIVATYLIRPPYSYIMPLYERSLADIMPNLPTDRDRALRIFNSVLEAMEYAHGQKVIHRDLSLIHI